MNWEKHFGLVQATAARLAQKNSRYALAQRIAEITLRDLIFCEDGAEYDERAARELNALDESMRGLEDAAKTRRLCRRVDAMIDRIERGEPPLRRRRRRRRKAA